MLVSALQYSGNRGHKMSDLLEMVHKLFYKLYETYFVERGLLNLSIIQLREKLQLMHLESKGFNNKISNKKDNS
jgi:hypothetical protein